MLLTAEVINMDESVSIGVRDKKVRVMGFDGWTQGSHHYIRLLEAFESVDLDLFLVHLGSWGDDINREKKEYIHGLLVYDISYFKNQSFPFILEELAPDIVLFLSTETFLHRAMLRYCRIRNIPTIHLFHGIIGSVPITRGEQNFTVGAFNQLANLFRRSRRYITKTLPIYGKSLIETNANVSAWLRFASDIGERFCGREILVPADDSRASKCCVYTPVDVDTARTKWGMEDQDIVVVGNPDLPRFGISPKMLGAAIDIHGESNGRMLVYIDTGLSSHRFNFNSDLENANFILEASRIVNEGGYTLLVRVKPHPEQRRDFMEAFLRDNGVKVLEVDDFLPHLLKSCGCITEPSSLGIIPCLLGLPVFLVNVGPLSSVQYGPLFRSYPRAKEVFEWREICGALTEKQMRLDVDCVRSWITDNAGPMPAEMMPTRVATTVLDLARISRKS